MLEHKGSAYSRKYLEDELLHQRELKSLLPTRTVALKNIPVANISPNPFQARQKFHNLDQLTQAVRSHGLATCLLWVRPDPKQPNAFQLIFGEKWLRAARTAGLQMVPCEVGNYNDVELYDIGMLENIRQGDLEPLEEAFALRSILEQQHCTLQELAARIGQETAYITSRLALLASPTAGQTTDSLHAPHPTRRYKPSQSYHAPARTSAAQDDNGGTRHDDTPGIQSWGNINLRTSASGPAVPRPAAPPNPPTSSAGSPGSLQRTVERDIQTLRGIVARWHGLLEQQNLANNSLSAYLDELRTEVERLIERLAHPPD